MSVISFSSCLGPGTPWSKEWCWCLAPICGTGISNTLGMEDTDAGPPSATTHNWVVADIPRRVASSMILVRSCRGTKVLPSSQESRLIWPPQMLGKPSPLPLSGASALIHFLCAPVGGIGCGCMAQLGLSNGLGGWFDGLSSLDSFR